MSLSSVMYSRQSEIFLANLETLAQRMRLNLPSLASSIILLKASLFLVEVPDLPSSL